MKGVFTMEKKIDIKYELYKLYQLDWMMERGYGLDDVIQGMNGEPVDHDDYIFDGPDGLHADTEKIFGNWQDEVGFPGGCLYVCFGEFCDNELNDVRYMHKLISRTNSLRQNMLNEAYREYLMESAS